DQAAWFSFGYQFFGGADHGTTIPQFGAQSFNFGDDVHVGDMGAIPRQQEVQSRHSGDSHMKRVRLLFSRQAHAPVQLDGQFQSFRNNPQVLRHGEGGQ